MNHTHWFNHGVDTPSTTHSLVGRITFSRTKVVFLALPAIASVQRVLAELRAYTRPKRSTIDVA